MKKAQSNPAGCKPVLAFHNARRIARCTITSPTGCALTAEGRLKEAIRDQFRHNTSAEICGRICPQGRVLRRHCW